MRQYRQMHVAYNNVFRQLIGYNKFCNACGMFVENRIDNFYVRIRLVYGFYQTIMCSRNSIVVMNRLAWLLSDLYRTWNKCLYVSEMVINMFSLLFFAVVHFVFFKTKCVLAHLHFC